MSTPSSTAAPSTDKTFITIEVKDLLSHGDELPDALVNFLQEKLTKDIKISLAEKEVYIRSDKAAHPSKTKLRVYLKRFLHLNGLRQDLKITSLSKDRFAIIEFITVVYVEE